MATVFNIPFKDIFLSPKDAGTKPTFIKNPQKVCYVSVSMRWMEESLPDRDLYEKVVARLRAGEIHVQLGGVPEQMDREFSVSFPVHGLKLVPHSKKPEKLVLRGGEAEKAIIQVIRYVESQRKLIHSKKVAIDRERMFKTEDIGMYQTAEQPATNTRKWF